MSQRISLENLSQEIKIKAQNRAYFVIALSGFGGAGKSTAAQKLIQELGGAVIIPLDEFITNRLSERSSSWDGFDWTRLVRQVLQPIREGKETITYGVYDWKQNKIVEYKILKLPKYIIVEGCGLIREQLKPYFDLSVWLDVPLEIASERGSTRDREEYKVDHDQFWEDRWTPNDRDYFETYHPEKLADYVIENV